MLIAVGSAEKRLHTFLLCGDEDLGSACLWYPKNFGGFLSKAHRGFGTQHDID